MLVGQQEQQIEVRSGGQRTAAITADTDDRHALAGRQVGGPENVKNGEIVEAADNFILQMGKPAGTDIAGAIFAQQFFSHFASVFGGFFQAGQHLHANLVVVAIAVRFAGERGQLLTQLVRINERIEMGVGFGHGRFITSGDGAKLDPFRSAQA